jgi:hypothetical protein
MQTKSIQAGEQSAKAAYNTSVKRTEALLKDIDGALVAHIEGQMENKNNWGYVGDINRINDLLEQVLSAIK